MPTQLTVEGMHCNSCKLLIEDALEELGADNILITIDESTQTGAVSFEGLDAGTAKRAIEDLGSYIVK